MIRAGDTLHNPVTGETLHFVRTSRDTGGEYVLVDATVQPNGFVAAAHVHPHQDERFEIVEGTVTFTLGKETLTAGPGDVVLVAGELGSGKTTFVRGACRALGVAEPVTSPTFTIGQVYEGDVEVAHLDLYRLSSLAGEDPALLEDYLTADRIGFVEWPEAGEPAIERVAVRVRLEHCGGDRRRIEVR